MTFKERAQDLFIPIRRKQRPLSGEQGNTTPISASTTSFSEPPRTPTGKPVASPESSKPPTKSSTFIPSSGVRYTVSTSTKNYNPFNFIPKSSSPLKPETSEQESTQTVVSKTISSQQNVRHTRNVSSPIPHASRRRSPTKDMSWSTKEYPAIDIDNLEAQISEEQITRAAIPTPFPSPESESSGIVMGSLWPQDDVFTTFDDNVVRTLPFRQTSTTARSIRADPSVLRPRSRESSLSSKDRSHPPSAFPAALQEHVQAPPEVLPSTLTTVNRGLHKNKIDRKAKRYTILGVSSFTPPPQTTSPRRRNSVGQQDKGSRSKPPISIYPEDWRPRPEEAAMHLWQSSQPHSKSSSRPSSRHSRPASSQRQSARDFTFHTTVHYYTNCSHSSPPSSRPLNEQPYLGAEASESSSQPAIYRSFIRGSCFDCDTARRRDEETQVLLHFSPEISRLTNDLTYLVSTLEEQGMFQQPAAISPPRTPVGRGFIHLDKLSPGRSSILTRGTTGSATTVNTTNTNAFTDTTSTTSESSHDTPEAIGRQVKHLQHIISQLSIQRDNEVNKIWGGYSARWGPGTLGVVQTKRAESVSSRSVSRAGTNSRPISMIETSDYDHFHIAYEGSRLASHTSSAQHSPQKSVFSETSINRQAHRGMENSRVPTGDHSSQPEEPLGPAVRRSQSVRSGRESSANSLYASLTRHNRDRSRDSTPNTPLDGRSVARTETGISYSNTDTPVGRMKVNWVRGREQE